MLAPSVDEAVYDGCFQVELDGEAFFGAPFQVVLGPDEDEVVVQGWGAPVRLRK